MVFKRYADDYETEITTDASGREQKKAVYRGKYYEIDLDEEKIIRFKKSSLVLLAAVTIVHVVGGFLNNKGMYQFFISLPYVVAFFPLLYMAMGIFRLPTEKRKFRRDEIGLSHDRMKSSSQVLLVLLSMVLIGELGYLLFKSAGEPLELEFIFLALEALAAAAVFVIIRLQRGIHAQPVDE